MDLTNFTILDIHQGLIQKQFSARELTKEFFDKIKREDNKIFAFLTLTEDLAFLQAKTVDSLISKKKNIPLLAGIPIAVKDNILVKDVKCTAASKILENYIAPYDATVIRKLKSQGVIILGKTNLDEFAMGSSCERSAFGPTKNPHDLNRVAGGSSGGSAAAVAADMCAFALGSDTCGSVRLPASFCGVVGLKPTYGAVSRYGLIALSSSLDQIGPITKSVTDAKIVLDAIKGKDPLDSTSIESKFLISNFQSSKLRIGIPKEYFVKGMDPEVRGLIKESIEKFRKVGMKVEEISLPHTEYSLSVYYIIMPAEASANLARYDGIKYGYSTKDEKNLMDVYLNSREGGFGEEVRRRIMLGTYILSAGYYDAYYLKAQKVRTLIKEDFEKAFKKVDVILTPTSPVPAFKLGERTKDPLAMYLSDVLMGAVNLAGLPAISLPCGKVQNDLPVGLQIIGKPFQEEEIFQLALLFEKL